MSDPIKDMEELDTINEKREALNLPAFDSIADARTWISEQAEQKPADEVKPVETKTDVVAEPVHVTAPVATAPVAIVAQPDGRVAELERHIQRQKSEEGRSTILANEVKDLKAELDAAIKAKEDAEQVIQAMASKTANDEAFALLTEEERESITPEAMHVIQKLVGKTVKNLEQKFGTEIASTRQAIEARQAIDSQRETQALQARADAMWERDIAPVIPSSVYGAFGANPKWADWNAMRYAGIANGELYANAVREADGQAVIDLFKRFMGYAGIEIPAKGKQPPLRAEESRGSESSDIIDANAVGPKKYFADDAKRIEDDYMHKARLPSGWTREQFNKWSDEIDNARAEGRVVDRATGKPVYD